MKRNVRFHEERLRAQLAEAALAAVAGGAFDNTKFNKITSSDTMFMEEGNGNTTAKRNGNDNSITLQLAGVDSQTVGNIIGTAQTQQSKNLERPHKEESKPFWQ